MGRRPCSSPSGGKLRTWRRGPASRQGGCWNAWRPSVNTDELEHQLYRAERRVREIQTKLHRWATDAPNGACGEPDARPTGTSGSGGGPEKPTSRNIGRALRVDLTHGIARVSLPES